MSKDSGVFTNIFKYFVVFRISGWQVQIAIDLSSCWTLHNLKQIRKFLDSYWNLK